MAIDPGIAKTGYAIGKDNKVYETGVIRTDSKLSDFERCKQITDKVEQLINRYDIKLLLIEEYHVYGNPLTAVGKSKGEKTIQVITHLQLLAEKLGIEHRLINHNSWKAKFKRNWVLVAMSDRFPELKQLFQDLNKKAKYTYKGTRRKGNLEDHELDAFKMLVPEILNLKKLLVEERHE